MQTICGLHLVFVVEVLKLPLDLMQRVGIEQLPELGIPEQLAKLPLIDRERLGAPFRQRRVAVIDVVRDVAEEQR